MWRIWNAISESGLYSLVMRSDKPQAKPFRKWVTSEVLPAIRKTGQYVAPVAAKERSTNFSTRTYAAEMLQSRCFSLWAHPPISLRQNGNTTNNV